MTGITMASVAELQFQLVSLTLVDELLTARGCVIDGVANEGWYARTVVITPAARGSFGRPHSGPVNDTLARGFGPPSCTPRRSRSTLPRRKLLASMSCRGCRLRSDTGRIQVLKKSMKLPFERGLLIRRR